MTLSTAVVTTFLISMGDNGITHNSIIKNTELEQCINCDLSSMSKLDKQYLHIYHELDSYKELQNNWDGYGGVRPNNELIKTTKNFIDILKNHKILQPKIMVSGNGEIGLFWKKQNTYIEIDFDEDKYLSFFYKTDEEIYGEDDIFINKTIPSKLYTVLNNLENQNFTKRNDSLIFDVNFTQSTNFLTELV